VGVPRDGDCRTAHYPCGAVVGGVEGPCPVARGATRAVLVVCNFARGQHARDPRNHLPILCGEAKV